MSRAPGPSLEVADEDDPVAAGVGAANGEANRRVVADHLKSACELALQMTVYDAADATLLRFSPGQGPLKDLHPKVVGLENWHGQTVESLVRTKLI